MKKICIPFIGHSKNEIFEFYKKTKAVKPDLLEIWLDYIPLENIKEVVQNKPFPLIVVCKGKEEKGNFKGTEEERIGKLVEAIKYGVDYIDVGYHTDKKLIEKLKKEIINKKSETTNTKLIISHHNWLQTPKFSTMEGIVEKISELKPDIIKLITTACSEFDNIQIYRLCENLKKNGVEFVIFTMGEKGKQSRIICSLLGSKWTYCPLDIKKSTAPGQIDIEHIKKIWAWI